MAQVAGPLVLSGTDHFRMMPMLGRHLRGGPKSHEDRVLVPLIVDFARRVCG